MNTKGLKVFFIYTTLLAFSSISSLVLLYVFKVKYLYILIVKVYTIIEYCLLVIMLSHFFKNKRISKWAYFSIVPYTIIAVTNSIQSKFNFSNFPLLVEFLILIVLLIYFFYEKMNLMEGIFIYQSISFWICVALFFYFCGNFFFLLFTTYNSNRNFTIQLQMVYTFVTITKNILLSISLFFNEANNTTPSNPFPEDIDLDAITPNKNVS